MKFLILFLVVLIFISSPSLTLAQQVRNAEVVTLEKNQSIQEDFFASGNSVIISGTVNGDAYILGENILIDGTIEGDILALGRNITINAVVSGDIRAIGEKITIYSQVEKNISAIGARIHLHDPSSLQGSLVGIGKDVNINTPLGKGATILAETLRLNSEVNGNLTAGIGKEITLTENANVRGNVTYHTDLGNTIKLESGASISGQTIHNVHVSDRQMHLGPSPFMKSVELFLRLLSLLSTLLIGLLLITFLPKYPVNVSVHISQKPFKSFFIGLVTFFISPFVIIILLLSLVGIPVALLLIPLLLALFIFAKIFFALFIGEMLADYLKKPWRTEIKFIIGLSVYGALLFVPIFGFLLSLIAASTGTGAFILEKLRLYKTMKNRRLI